MPFFNCEIAPKGLVAGYSDSRGTLFVGEKLKFGLIHQEEGEGARPHRHPEEQVIFVLEGRVWFRIGDEEKELGPGEAALIPSGVEHENRVLKGPFLFFTCRSQPFTL